MAKNSRLCRVQPPGAAPETPKSKEISASFPPLPPASASRAADGSDGFKPERRPVPGHHLVPGTVSDSTRPIIGPDKSSICDERRALWRQAGSSATDKAASFAAQITQTGRRLMRQTVLPTITGKITPMRSARLARRSNSGRARSARRANLRFGLPLTPESGGPSRHPAAQNLRAVPRARRRQEFQNAQQDAYRCHPPGGDPGRRGPRQSRRRI